MRTLAVEMEVRLEEVTDLAYGMIDSKINFPDQSAIKTYQSGSSGNALKQVRSDQVHRRVSAQPQYF